MMRCVKAKRWMSLQIDGSLSSDRVGKLERHVRQCVGCQAERRMLARIHEVLIAEPEEKLAVDVFSRIESRLEDKQEGIASLGSVWGVLRWAAIPAAAVAVAALIWGQGSQPGRAVDVMPTQEVVEVVSDVSDQDYVEAHTEMMVEVMGAEDTALTITWASYTDGP